MELKLQHGKTKSGRTSYIAYCMDEGIRIEIAKIVRLALGMWHIDMIVTGERFWASTSEDAFATVRQNR